MNCSVLSTLYMRSNGDVPCHDDAGEKVILGRVPSTTKGWSADEMINGPVYTSIRQALKEQRPPWPGVCETCAWFRPREAYSETLLKKVVSIFQVEPSLACNLKCPACSQPRQILERPKPYKMPPELFGVALRGLKDDGYKLNEIEYCGQGEAMTHPQFGEFVTIARTIFPETRQRLITNGNFDYSRAKLTSAVDEIMVSCDGARQASYECYRIGGTLDKVLKFMRDIPKAVGGQFQKVTWKYILFEFNDSDNELMEAQRLAEKYGVDQLQFVITHSAYKSQRYTAENCHLIPVVWSRVVTTVTPIQLKGRVSFAPVVPNAPPQTVAEGVIFTLDEVIMNGINSLHLHGWVLSDKQAVDRVRIFHNGKMVAETSLLDRRPDVRAAYPAYQGMTPGFAVSWKTDDIEAGVHCFSAQAVSLDGRVIAVTSKDFRVL